MGTLIYGTHDFPMTNRDLAVLQEVTRVALAGDPSRQIEPVAAFVVELGIGDGVVSLLFAPGVPILFDFMDAEPAHDDDLDDMVHGAFEEAALGGGPVRFRVEARP